MMVTLSSSKTKQEFAVSLGVLVLLSCGGMVRDVGAAKVLFESPETDNVTTWQDAKEFCEEKSGKLITQEALCDFFKTEPLSAGSGTEIWSPTILIPGGEDEHWIQITGKEGDQNFCQPYDVSVECPEKLTGLPTSSPTQSPTNGPLDIYICGEEPGSVVTVHSNGANFLSLSTLIEKHSVCVLERASDGVAFGRIYDGGDDWQRSAISSAATKLDFNCTDGGYCDAVIPDDGNEYQLVTYRSPKILNSKEEASRFLATTTFGPRMDEIEQLAASSSKNKYKDWILKQMDPKETPPSSHREYFRRRANQRMVTTNRIARPRSPCEAKSRWHGFAFTEEDQNDVFVISGGGLISNKDTKAVFTEVDGAWRGGLNSATTKEFMICTVVEELNGAMEIDSAKGGCMQKDALVLVTNPAIVLDGSQVSKQEVLVDKTELLPLDPPIEGVRVLSQTSSSAICSEPEDADVVFIKDPHSGDYYRHDGRMLLIENTLQSPASPGTMKDTSTDGSYALTFELLCPNVAMNFQNQDSCVVTDEPVCGSTSPLSLICGSVGEVGNDPSVGSRFPFLYPKKDTNTGKRYEDAIYKGHQSSKSTWVMLSLFGKDQLRQRVAFALYGILIVGAPGTVFHEARNQYYDIFVRNAFGNYRDVLKEVSYHSLMGDYLTYRASRSMANSGTLPDENYARELMQLFTIGLSKLEMNGEMVVDDDGQPVPTYLIEDIMSIARVWTGFYEAPYRGNIEVFDSGHRFRNRMDPMIIEMWAHDLFPKTDLQGGYLGDRYPLCTDLPAKDFLRKGATFEFIGSSASPGLVLDSSSDLFKKLCNTAAGGGPCKFAPRVVLDRNLVCAGSECDANSVEVIRVGDAVYKHVPRPCVSLQFFNGGKKVARMYKEHGWWREACVDPRSSSTAGEVCCDHTSHTWKPLYSCPADRDYFTFSELEQRCQDKGLEVCTRFHRHWSCESGCCPDEIQYGWSGAECLLKVRVDHEGHVATVHDLDSPHEALDHKKPPTWYNAFWEDENDMPSVDKNGCHGGSCEVVGTTCVCDQVVVEDTPAFLSMPASRDDVLSQLKVGSFPPTLFDAGSYVEESSRRMEESSSTEDVRVYVKKGESLASINTIFEVEDEVGNVVYLKNIASTVSVAGGKAKFRNPPSFVMPFQMEEDRAHYEVNALLDHLMAHSNIAPFVAYRLIQRLGNSNPSPAYIETVAKAFRSGKYEDIGSGKDGDLAATVAAVLLHPEARTVALDADPSQGQLREPLLKIMYALRSLEVATKEPEEQIMLRNGLNNDLGQMAHEATSIFSWFKPEHTSLGTRANQMGLVTPESEIITSPQVVFYINTMMALARYGVSIKGWGPGDSVETVGDMTFQSSSPRVATPVALPEGLELNIEKGFMEGDPVEVPTGVNLTVQAGEGPKCKILRDSIIWCSLEKTVVDTSGSHGATLRVSGSGGSFTASVIRWAWNGNMFIFQPSADYDLAAVNEALLPGDSVELSYNFTEQKCLQQFDNNGNPYRVRCSLELTRNFVSEPHGKKHFDITGSGGSFSAKMIHWAWQGIHLFMTPNVTIDEVNAALPPGSPISLSVIEQDPIDELDLLLTNGRLTNATRATIAKVLNGGLGSDGNSALQYAYQLFFMSAEYQFSNTPNGIQQSLPSKPEQEETGKELQAPKTIVYLQLSGGADSFNLLVPHSKCSGGDLWSDYNISRDDLAIPKDDLYVINVPAGTQPCEKFGMHPSLKFLSTLYKDGDLLWTANTGTLVEPVDRDEVKSKKTPNNNFAHNSMTNWAEKVDTNDNRALGVLGRIADGLKGRHKAHAFSVRNTSPIQENDPNKSPLPDFISNHAIEVLHKWNFLDQSIPGAIQNLTEPCTSIYCDLWTSALRQGVKRSEELKAVVDANPVKADAGKYWKTDEQVEKSLKQISRLIAGSEALGVDRLTFSAVQHGFDAHFDNVKSLSEPIGKVDTALESFVAEMKALGKWKEVVVVIGSEFGRALASNGEGGCDHGWGGNYMVLGGGIKGGQVLGDFIDDFNPATNHLMMRGGRVIPDTPWEAVWNGVAEWFGVPADRMDDVLPLRGNFPGRLFGGADMFKEPIPEQELQSQRQLKTCEIDPNYIVCETSHPNYRQPTVPKPTAPTTPKPTAKPTNKPTSSPTDSPTAAPSVSPTTLSPTISSGHPSVAPTTGGPTGVPTTAPTGSPTPAPTLVATGTPTSAPSGTQVVVLPSFTITIDSDIFITTDPGIEEYLLTEMIKAGLNNLIEIFLSFSPSPAVAGHRRLEKQVLHFTGKAFFAGTPIHVEEVVQRNLEQLLNNKEALSAAVANFLGGKPEDFQITSITLVQPGDQEGNEEDTTGSEVNDGTNEEGTTDVDLGPLGRDPSVDNPERVDNPEDDPNKDLNGNPEEGDTEREVGDSGSDAGSSGAGSGAGSGSGSDAGSSGVGSGSGSDAGSSGAGSGSGSGSDVGSPGASSGSGSDVGSSGAVSGEGSGSGDLGSQGGDTPGAFGDPHFVTFGGSKYDFHAACDLVLLNNPMFRNGVGMTIHVRTKLQTWWSFVQAAAIRIGHDILELEGGNNDYKFFVNGVEGGAESTISFSQLGLNVQFKRVNAHQLQLRVDLADGDAVGLQTFKQFVRVDVKAKNPANYIGSTGLMGSYPTGAWATRDNSTVLHDAEEFGVEWQVRMDDDPNLFHTPPQHPTTCQFPSAEESNVRRHLQASDMSREVAERACKQVHSPTNFLDCVADVLATQDLEMAGAY